MPVSPSKGGAEAIAPGWEGMSKSEKRLGYERTEPPGPLKIKVYVSPYKQSKPVVLDRVKLEALQQARPGSKGKTLMKPFSPSSPSGKSGNNNARQQRENRIVRNASVDELMAKLSNQATNRNRLNAAAAANGHGNGATTATGYDIMSTLTEPGSRIHDSKSASSGLSKGGGFKVPMHNHSGSGGGDIADDASELSHGTYGTLGSMGNMSVMSKTSLNGKKYHSVHVEFDDEVTGGVRVVDYTMRTMVEEIGSCAKSGAPVPSYVPLLEELPMSLLSWNGKDNFKAAMRMKKRSQRGSNPISSDAGERKGRGIGTKLLPLSEENDTRFLSPSKGKAPPQKQQQRQQQQQQQQTESEAHRNKRAHFEKELDSITHTVEGADGLFDEVDFNSYSNTSTSVHGGSSSSSVSSFGKGNIVNKKYSVPPSSSSSLPMRVDIIGMYQNIPLILARADERCRKQVAVLAAKKDLTERRRRELMDHIAHNMTRSERYAEVLRVQQLQVIWLKIVQVMKFQAHLQKVRGEISIRYLRNKRRIWAATTLAFAIKMYIRNRMIHKINHSFMNSIGSSFWVLQCAIRCKKKVIALKRIKFFLSLFQGKNRIKEVVHRFVKSALMIQRMCRNFVYCHRARIEVMKKIWDKIEIGYIEDILAKRKAEELKSGIVADKKNKAIAKGKKEEKPIVDDKTRIEMDKIAKQWQEQETRMEELLDRHRKAGIIVKESLRGNALTLVLPEALKTVCIEKFIIMKRREYMIKMEAMAAEFSKTLDIFKPDDAHDLLLGNMEKIDKTIRSKYASSLNWYRSGKKSLFMIFKNTEAEKRCGEDIQTILLRVLKSEHDRVGTFVIKVRTAKKKNGGGFDMAIHKKKAAAAAAAAKAKLEAEAATGTGTGTGRGTEANGGRPNTGNILSSSNGDSRPGTRGNGIPGKSPISRPGTTTSTTKEDDNNKVLENEGAVNLLKMMLGGKK